LPDEEGREPVTHDFDPKKPYRPNLKDQVEGLKARLDSGEISEVEYEAAKRKLLGEWEGRDFDERQD
jgi:hypothetical protein